MTATILCGDVVAVLPTLEAESFDACLCDPPYGLGFMGKVWDHGVPSAEVWREVLRVLKPGAMLLAFGGTRTHHRLAVAIEDAGFEIRDCLVWMYGQGFPKSLDISKALDKAAGAEGTLGEPKTAAHAGWIKRGRMRGDEGHDGYQRPWMGDPEKVEAKARQYLPATDAASKWQGYGTALKPAWEPIIVAMKPLAGTFAQNAVEHGVAGLNVDGCRIGDCAGWSYPNGAGGNTFHGQSRRTDPEVSTAGRWPANVILDEEAAARLDEQSGSLTSGNLQSHHRRRGGGLGGSETFAIRDRTGEPCNFGGDTGGASRFFYTAKATTDERNTGLAGARNHHPTVKPLEVCEWLAKLILPPARETPRRLLVPFAGSGSEVVAAMRVGWDEALGIELEREYVEIAEARIAALAVHQRGLFA